MAALSRREREQEEREAFIISRAEELFCTKGYEATSMDDLARETEFTKRTLYRYFTCKEDLFFAVVLKGTERLMTAIKSEDGTAVTGLHKIRRAYDAYYAFYKEQPQLMKLINLSHAIKSAGVESPIPFKEKYLALDKEMFHAIIQMFMEGKADGSVRSDLEISQLALSSLFVATGFFQLYAASGSSYVSHFGLDSEAFIQSALKMMTDYIKK